MGTSTIVVGAGIFGVTAALALRRRGAGRHVVLGRARWVSSDLTIPLFTNDGRRTLEGAPELVFEATFDETLAGALAALTPGELRTPDGAADAVEALERLSRALSATRPDASARALRLRT